MSVTQGSTEVATTSEISAYAFCYLFRLWPLPKPWWAPILWQSVDLH